MVPDLNLEQFLSTIRPAQADPSNAASSYANNYAGNSNYASNSLGTGGQPPTIPLALQNTENPLLYWEADDPT